ncbi:MAG: quinone-dependent dihydroorotate dehydrogenase [Neisseriaceae bacterium]|nr:quinone-dependent dihydroorotate dehydrogenase [Neisseriaceae bacterium]
MDYSFFQKILFSMDAERSHLAALNGLNFLHKLHLDPFGKETPKVPCKLMDLTLPNPVGLAAGLDKNGEFIDALAAFGFGFIEIGTVTPKPQAGNPKPRLFRLPEQRAIVNRMGFNNHGIDSVLANIRRSKYDGILGINIGKNATTQIEIAVDDYLICLKKAYELASYITINISSPNTKNLRSLQGEDELNQLLAAIKFCQNDLANQHNKYVPIALKIAPDLDENQIIAIAKAVRFHQIDGVIATNTTVDKSSLGNHPLSNEAGGLSGSPLKNKANEVLSILSKHLNPPNKFAIPIIGVGGISSGEDAVEKLQKGANAVQIYSGLIYQGPQLVRECVHFIQKYQSQK